MATEPKFYTQPRRGKTSLWVDTRETGRRNIWDIPTEQCTPAVLEAIRQAFKLGVSLCQEISSSAVRDAVYISTLSGWEKRDDEWQ